MTEYVCLFDSIAVPMNIQQFRAEILLFVYSS